MQWFGTPAALPALSYRPGPHWRLRARRRQLRGKPTVEPGGEATCRWAGPAAERGCLCSEANCGTPHQQLRRRHSPSQPTATCPCPQARRVKWAVVHPSVEEPGGHTVSGRRGCPNCDVVVSRLCIHSETRDANAAIAIAQYCAACARWQPAHAEACQAGQQLAGAGSRLDC